MIQALEADGNGINGNKRWRLVDGSFTINVEHPAEEVVQVKEATFRIEVTAQDVAAPLVGLSRVSGSISCEEVDNNPLQLQLLPNAITDRYLERVKKLRVELKRVALDDHDWWIKTFDLNGYSVVTVIKLWCAECKKDYSECNTVHTKAQIENLFNNFRQSHVVSVSHVRNYCEAKHVNFEDHLWSESKNGRPITVTPEDHKQLIAEGVHIMEAVNLTLPEGMKKFAVLGN